MLRCASHCAVCARPFEPRMDKVACWRCGEPYDLAGRLVDTSRNAVLVQPEGSTETLWIPRSQIVGREYLHKVAHKNIKVFVVTRWFAQKKGWIAADADESKNIHTLTDTP